MIALLLIAAAMAPSLRAQDASLRDQRARGEDVERIIVRGVESGERDAPRDPSVIEGRLANGMRIIVWATEAMPERATLWLDVGAGALDEKDEEQGAAALVHRLAYRSTEHFPDDAASEALPSLGIEFDPLNSGWATLDHSTFILEPPVRSEEAMEQALLFLSDALGRVRFSDAIVEREKAMLIEELRARLGWQQRVRDAVLPHLAPDAGIEDHPPLPTLASVQALDVDDARAYWARVYDPARATLIIAGDVSPPRAIEMAAKAFAPLERDSDARPAAMQAQFDPMDSLRTVALGDPDIVAPVIEIGRTTSALDGVRTATDLRSWIVNRVGERALDERLSRLIDRGEASFDRLATYSNRIFDGLHYAAVNVNATTPDWREPLTELVREVERVRLHGFTRQEIAGAARLVAADLRASIDPRPEGWTHRRLGPLVEGARTGGAAFGPLWAASRLESVSRALAPDDMAAWARERLDPRRSLALIVAPGEAPDAGEIERTIREAIEAPIEEVFEGPVAIRLLDGAPPPGAVESIELDSSSDVLSLWLANGVRAHHLWMDTPADEARVTILLAGGRIEEDERTRGLSSAAAAALESPASDDLTGAQVRHALRAAGVTLEATAGADSVRIELQGPASAINRAFEAAHLALDAPRVEPATLIRWKQRQIEAAERRKRQPGSALSELLAGALHPADEVRLHPLSQGRVAIIDLERAQAWLDRLVSTAPIEVAVVGEVERDVAIDLVATYLGSLEPRPRISRTSLADRRTIRFRQPPYSLIHRIATPTAHAIVLVGALGAEEEHSTRSLAMDAAAMVLANRINDEIRGEEGLAFSVGARHSASEAYPGAGLLSSWTYAPPSKAEHVADVIERVFEQTAQSGPTDPELAAAKARLVTRVEEELSSARWWAGELAELTYRGRALGDLTGLPHRIGALNRDDLREALGEAARSDRRVRVIIGPREDAPAP